MIFEQYLAIDYGTSYIKGILYKEILGSVTILRSESLKLVRFESEETDEYEYNIVRFIQSFFPEENNFAINLPLNKLFIRDIVLPVTAEKAIKEIMPSEVENVVPFPIEDMTVQGNRWKIENDTSRIISFSVHNKDLDGAAKPFGKTDQSIKCISTDPYSLSSIGRHFFGKTITENFIGQLDIGGKVSIFNLLNNGSLIHSRYFYGGGDFVTENIRNLLKMGLEEAEELKHAIKFSILNPVDEEILEFIRQYGITDKQLESILQMIRESIKLIGTEVLKSIHTLHGVDKPAFVYLSGGGCQFKDTEKFLFDLTGIQFRRYEFLEIEDESFINCLSIGYHYRLKRNEKIDFLTPEFEKKLNKNLFKLSNFKVPLILTCIAMFILVSVFITQMIIETRQIRINEEVLRQKFQQGFGREVAEDEDPLSLAVSEVNKEQKKSEIVRLFLGKESILDLILEITQNFPNRDDISFVLDQFTYDGNEIQIYGRTDTYKDTGTIEETLQKSKKFKNVVIDNRRIIQGVNKLATSFKIKMELASTAEKDKPSKSKEDSNAE